MESIEIVVFAVSLIVSNVITWLFTAHSNSREDKKDIRELCAKLIEKNQALGLVYINFKNSFIAHLKEKPSPQAVALYMGKVHKELLEIANLNIRLSQLGETSIMSVISTLNMQILVLMEIVKANLDKRTDKRDKLLSNVLIQSKKIEDTMDEIVKVSLDRSK